MAKFMLIIWTNGEAWGQMSQEEQQGLFKEYFEYTQWLQDQGWFQHGDPLQPPAKTVQVRNGKTQAYEIPRWVPALGESVPEPAGGDSENASRGQRLGR